MPPRGFKGKSALVSPWGILQGSEGILVAPPWFIGPFAGGSLGHAIKVFTNCPFGRPLYFPVDRHPSGGPEGGPPPTLHGTVGGATTRRNATQKKNHPPTKPKNSPTKRGHFVGMHFRFVFEEKTPLQNDAVHLQNRSCTYKTETETYKTN